MSHRPFLEPRHSVLDSLKQKHDFKIILLQNCFKQTLRSLILIHLTSRAFPKILVLRLIAHSPNLVKTKTKSKLVLTLYWNRIKLVVKQNVGMIKTSQSGASGT